MKLMPDQICNCKRKELALLSPWGGSAITLELNQSSVHWTDTIIDKHDIEYRRIRCFSAQLVQTSCWRSSQWANSDFSAARAPISTVLRPSSSTRCTWWGKRSTMSSAARKPGKTPTQRPYSAPIFVIVAASAPTSSKSKSDRLMSRQPSFIAASIAATNGKSDRESDAAHI